MDDRPIETTASGVPERFELFDAVLFRELAEVYLLIDHITSRSDKRLPPVIDIDPNGKFNGQNWLAELYRITWPPEGSRREIADQAEFLIRTRDALNRLVAPAAGATIAFTLMAVGEDHALEADVMSKGDGGEACEPGAAMPAGRSRPPDLFSGSPGEHARPPANQGAADDRATHRRRHFLATQAFPHLELAAESFSRFNTVMVGQLQLWLIITLALSAYVAVGNNLLHQSHFARTAYEGTLPSRGSPSGQPIAAAPSKTADPSVSENNDPVYLCNRYVAARSNLANWAKFWTFLAHWRFRYPQRDFCSGDGRSVTAPSDAADIGAGLWAAALVNMFGKLLLPACYGFLGALAAVVRRLSSKMKNSELAQRDRMLCKIQLALGAVIGVCVGLFVTPGDNNASASSDLVGLLTVAHVSTSALSFLAGFGIEHVFLFLEGLLNRAFNLPDATSKTS